MKKIFSILMTVAVLMLGLTACQPAVQPSAPSGPEPASPDSGSDAADSQSALSGDEGGDGETSSPVTPIVAPVTDGSGLFEYDLAAFIEKGMGDSLENYMVSPLSFQYALGMVLAGADGATRDQLLNALGVDSEAAFESRIESFSAFAERFNAEKDRQKAEYASLPSGLKKQAPEPSGALRVADSVWKADGLPDFQETYESKLERYDAEYFTFTPSDIVGRANRWAKDKTEGLIPRILPDNYDASSLALLLMNALYYKNGWQNPFREAPETVFTTLRGAQVEKDFISSTEHYRYYKDDQTELVVVPMQENVYMTFVLGDASDLNGKIARAEYKLVRFCVPTFKIESSFEQGELVRFLADRGASDLFDGEKADLSGMTDRTLPDRNLYVDDIIQKTKIKLDETGVEAAAVTAISVRATSSVKPEAIISFTADRPFRFFIHAGGNESADPSEPAFVLFEGLLAE